MLFRSDLESRCAYLNGLGLKYLRYKSADGTDLQVELNEDGIFCGGDEKTLKGRVFNPNIPSEEVFTSPKADAERAAREVLFYDGIPACSSAGATLCAATQLMGTGKCNRPLCIFAGRRTYE